MNETKKPKGVYLVHDKSTGHDTSGSNKKEVWKLGITEVDKPKRGGLKIKTLSYRTFLNRLKANDNNYENDDYKIEFVPFINQKQTK